MPVISAHLQNLFITFLLQDPGLPALHTGFDVLHRHFAGLQKLLLFAQLPPLFVDFAPVLMDHHFAGDRDHDPPVQQDDPAFQRI